MKDGIHPHGDVSMCKKKQTNADRIRAMSNEELADFISEQAGFSKDHWLKWLQSESEI